MIIEQAYGGPKITKDGVTVAKAIELKDKVRAAGGTVEPTEGKLDADAAARRRSPEPWLDGPPSQFQNLGARLVQDVANKANDEAGDGTTTATVLARAIFAGALKNVTAGINPTDLRRGIMLAVDAVVEVRGGHTKPIARRPHIADESPAACAACGSPDTNRT